jgi:hypothetical protein
MPLPTRKIGTTDVTAIGYGAMGISAYYGAVESDEERLKVRGRIQLPSECSCDNQFLDALYERYCVAFSAYTPLRLAPREVAVACGTLQTCTATRKSCSASGERSDVYCWCSS